MHDRKDFLDACKQRAIIKATRTEQRSAHNKKLMEAKKKSLANQLEQLKKHAFDS